MQSRGSDLVGALGSLARFSPLPRPVSVVNPVNPGEKEIQREREKEQK